MFERPSNAGVTALEVFRENRAGKGCPRCIAAYRTRNRTDPREADMAGADFGARQSKVSTSDGVFVRPFADYAVAGKYVRWVLSRNNATVTDYWNQVVRIRAGLPRR
jgi:hypothetical protein